MNLLIITLFIKKEAKIFKAYRDFLEYEELISKFDWDSYCAIFESFNSNIKTLSRNYFKYIVEKNYYSGNYKDFLKDNIWVLDIKKGMTPAFTFYKGSKPYYFYEVQIFNNGRVSHTRFNLKSNNFFIKDILIKFIQTLSNKEKQMTRYKVFINRFEDSVYSLEKHINTIFDFDYNVFRKQYRFYKNIEWNEHKSTVLLNRFYIFLNNYIDDKGMNHSIFTPSDYIDKYYLYKNNFAKYYEKGYRIIRLNRFEPMPKTDRWMVAPNGEEKKSIARKSYEYYPINFSKVNNRIYRNAFKQWYWQAENSIFVKDKYSYVIREFLIFIDHIHSLRNNSKGVNSLSNNKYKKRGQEITAKDIIQYRLYLKSKYDNNTTLTSNITAVKTFLEFCDNENTLLVELKAFYYLKGFRKQQRTAKPLTKGDLNKIVAQYKQLALEGGVLEKLQRCIITLLLTTNLRIREILGLRRDCLVETMKKGQYAVKYRGNIEEKAVLKVIRKHSVGSYCEENISIFTYRLIQEAICITEELSNIADEAVENYIFLNVSTKKIIKVIDKDIVDSYLERVMKQLDLDNNRYSIYNLRDTYMTNIYDEGKKRGLTIEEIHPATGHKDIGTTIKHYRESDIRNYLEAFYGIEISDVDIKGNITTSINNIEEIQNEEINSAIVSENCGYCKNKGCGDLKKVDCLICTNFVTTLDRIDYFKERISRLDKIIVEEPIEHEKEHLLKIKQLLLGYIKRLYILKAKVINNA